jgi:drug/metabolite transporter (DMT)-like permease
LITTVAEPSTHNSGRRWTVVGAGILCGLLALVILYTKPRAFHSPLAVVVVAAIGLAALLLQITLYNRQQNEPLRAPKWLNIIGILCALIAVFGDAFGLRAQITQTMALGAILTFSISGAVIMHSLRKRRIAQK